MRRPGGDHEDLAQQSADDALLALLGKLGEFRGESRFTTWAYKLALLEAGVKVRRHAWQGREVPLENEAWIALADARRGVSHEAETRDLIAALGEEIERSLSAHQRAVLSRWPSTMCRSTSSPSASAQIVALSIRRFTTRDGSCVAPSPNAAST